MRIRARHYATGELVDVVCGGGRIQSVGPPGREPADRKAGWVAPALFDLQINGCEGRSFTSKQLTTADVRHVVEVCRRHGIGGLCPTVVTNSFAVLAHGLRTIRQACEADPDLAAALPAIHLEGPYISAEDGPRGAHPREHVRPPDWDEFCQLQDEAGGRIRLVTLAPEHESALAFIERLARAGVSVALGHTAATGARIRDAVKAGARLSTHLGNGSHALLPRHDNYVWEQLATDELWASLICDGHHLPPSVVRCMVRVKTPARTIVTCDASSLAGLPPGRYAQWGEEIEIQPSGKLVVTSSGYLAGSGNLTDVCVGNVIRFAGVSLAEAVDMAGARPRELLGLPARTLAPGCAADLMLFDWEKEGAFRVATTLLAHSVAETYSGAHLMPAPRTTTTLNHSRSRAAFERACRLLPGGVDSPARAFGAVGGHPLFIERGEGPYLFDIDGNRYLDYVGSWGPLILGHCHPRVVRAVEDALRKGASFGAPTELESDLAELIIELVPSIEMVRLVSSGTEASMSAIRLARGATGRDVIVKFAGCYHGHVDSLLVAAGSSATTLGVPSSPGVPKGCTADTLVLRYNDIAALAEAFRAQGDRIAGVILEPVVGNMGLVVPRPEFLTELRRLTQQHGALLIYDEVITGFRLGTGGAQELYGQKPDLTVLGKIVGGGLPVGAYGGRVDLMKQVMPAGPVFQAGTLSGNPLAMAAGLATLRELKANPPYARLEELGRRLAEGLHQAADAAGVPHQLVRVGSMWTLFFNPEPVTDYDTAKKSDTARFARFFWAMMERGVYLPCSQFEAAFLSATHTEAHVQQTVDAAREALREIG
jgi:glutamate-1-semialdehyde 2,1-aminomutase